MPHDAPRLKQALRRRMRTARTILSEAERAMAATAIHKQLTRLDLPRFGARIAVYLARPPEADIDTFVRDLLARGVQVFAPDAMTFHRLYGLAAVKTGAFGVREPVGGEIAGELDVMLMPGLAFDRDGGRVGQGGGWYDRVLAGRAPGRPLTIGIGYDFQIVEAVPREKHDQRLDVVVTPRRVLDVGGFLAASIKE